MKRSFSTLSIAEAMKMVPANRLHPWAIDAPSVEPSAMISEYLRRLRVFDLQNTEAAKLLLIDALFAEIVPSHAPLKVWKAMGLESDEVTGVADYLISPDYAFVKAPLLCVVEAKRDDFVQGLAQCVAEMVACRWQNRQENLEIDIYGIVSNGQQWQFYRLTVANEVYESAPYALQQLPELLGALDRICALCAQNVP